MNLLFEERKPTTLNICCTSDYFWRNALLLSKQTNFKGWTMWTINYRDRLRVRGGGVATSWLLTVTLALICVVSHISHVSGYELHILAFQRKKVLSNIYCWRIPYSGVFKSCTGLHYVSIHYIIVIKSIIITRLVICAYSWSTDVNDLIINAFGFPTDKAFTVKLRE